MKKTKNGQGVEKDTLLFTDLYLSCHPYIFGKDYMGYDMEIYFGNVV